MRLTDFLTEYREAVEEEQERQKAYNSHKKSMPRTAKRHR